MQFRKRLAFFLAFVLMICNLCGCLPAQEPTLDFKVEDVRVPVFEPYVPSEDEDNHIMMGAAVGSWTRDIVNDYSYGIRCSFDMRESTKWNPQANQGYVGDPGVVYLLDGYYDVDSLRMKFIGTYYFDLLGSDNGVDYTLLKSVTKENAAEFYDEESRCTLENLEAKHISYIRIMFKGADKNNPFVNFHELSFEGTYLAPGPVFIPEEEDPNKLPDTLIQSYFLHGTWTRDLSTDGSYGPDKAYDNNVFSFWNPLANVGFADEPGIIFSLKAKTNIGKLEFIFGGDKHYFDVYVSQNGEDYTEIAKISYLNEEKAYTVNANGDLVCTLDGINLADVTYVKVIFTGRASGTRYVNFKEAVVSEEITEGVDTSWMIPDLSDVEVKATVEAYEFTYNGAPSTDAYHSGLTSDPRNIYDGNLGSMWNPAFKTPFDTYQPGLGLHLDNYYDLTKIVFTFGKNTSYFKVLVSSDNQTFTEMASVTEDSQYDADRQVVLDGLSAENVKYVRIVFTGGASWGTLNEMEIYGTLAK
ncbi:MAG: discoidin domain-containing protein [Ruminococcaceae bacterium]|nr:discoidin domain-containing protein [Oscillospiraceae bacterium]